MKDIGAMVFVALILLGMAIMHGAYASEYIEGKHYQKAPSDVADNELIQDLMKQANGKVQVLEFFSYGCSWCYKLDPYMEKWRKGPLSNVDFQRVPVEFHPTWGTLTKAYYTAVDLNELDKTHVPLFEAVHTEKINNTSEDTLKQFFVGLGIPEKDFTQTFDSFDVTRRQKWANTIAKAYKITSIPVVIVQGPKGVYITAVRMAGSEDNLIKVVDELVDMQNKAIGSSHKSALKLEPLKPAKNTQ